jgi:hypothetical protein
MPTNIIGLGLLVAGVIFMIMGGVVLIDFTTTVPFG